MTSITKSVGQQANNTAQSDVENFTNFALERMRDVEMPAVPAAYNHAFPKQILNTLADTFTVINFNQEIGPSWTRFLYYEIFEGGRGEMARYEVFNYNRPIGELILTRPDLIFSILIYGMLRPRYFDRFMDEFIKSLVAFTEKLERGELGDVTFPPGMTRDDWRSLVHRLEEGYSLYTANPSWIGFTLDVLGKGAEWVFNFLQVYDVMTFLIRRNPIALILEWVVRAVLWVASDISQEISETESTEAFYQEAGQMLAYYEYESLMTALSQPPHLYLNSAIKNRDSIFRKFIQSIKSYMFLTVRTQVWLFNSLRYTYIMREDIPVVEEYIEKGMSGLELFQQLRFDTLELTIDENELAAKVDEIIDPIADEIYDRALFGVQGADQWTMGRVIGGFPLMLPVDTVPCLYYPRHLCINSYQTCDAIFAGEFTLPTELRFNKNIFVDKSLGYATKAGTSGIEIDKMSLQYPTLSRINKIQELVELIKIDGVPVTQHNKRELIQIRFQSLADAFSGLFKFDLEPLEQVFQFPVWTTISNTHQVTMQIEHAVQMMSVNVHRMIMLCLRKLGVDKFLSFSVPLWNACFIERYGWVDQQAPYYPTYEKAIANAQALGERNGIQNCKKHPLLTREEANKAYTHYSAEYSREIATYRETNIYKPIKIFGIDPKLLGGIMLTTGGLIRLSS